MPVPTITCEISCGGTPSHARPESRTPAPLVLPRRAVILAIRRRGITPISPGSEARIEPPSTATKPPIPRPTPSDAAAGGIRLGPGGVHDPEQHAHEEDTEKPAAQVRAPRLVGVGAAEGPTVPTSPPGEPAAAPGGRDVGEAPLAELGEDEAVLDAAGAAEDVGVVDGGVALAEHVGGAELELGGQRGGAGPLDVLGAVRGALVRAAEHVDFVQGAHARGGDAAELRDRGHAAVAGLPVCAQGEGLDLREEDGVFGLAC